MSSMPPVTQALRAIGHRDERKVLLASPYNIEGRAWGGVCFEFLHVVQLSLIHI